MAGARGSAADAGQGRRLGQGRPDRRRSRRARDRSRQGAVGSAGSPRHQRGNGARAGPPGRRPERQTARAAHGAGPHHARRAVQLKAALRLMDPVQATLGRAAYGSSARGVMLAVLSLLGGCQFAQGPTVAESKLAAAAQDRGRMYVYRSYNYIGSAGSPTIAIDNVPIGPVHMVGALYCDLPPGNYVVSAFSPGVTPFPAAAKIEAGQSTYLQVSPGFVAWDLRVASPQNAAAEIQSMRLTPAVCPSPEAKPTATSSARAMDDVLARGSEAEKRGDFAAALAIYTEALQKHVTRFDSVAEVVDRAIDVALRMRPPPPVPESAKQHAAAAEAAIRNAKLRADLSVARREYANALADAPWWADVWFNLAKVDEQLGNTAEMRRDLGWYLRAAPDAPDRDQIRKQIEALR